MLRLEEALDQILREAKPLPAIELPLLDTLGKYLAEDVFADIDLPPFDNSAVDGYAVRAEDTVGASAERPIVLREVAEITAGSAPGVEVSRGTAARIMTGAPMPSGANAVVMIEDTRSDGSAASASRLISILEAATPELHVRRAGEDLRTGSRVLSRGTVVRPAVIAMLATMGRPMVRVLRPPRVAVFSTGDELVDIELGGIPSAGKIRDSNRYTLAAMVRDAGATVHSIAHLPDDQLATENALAAAADPVTGADVILTAGGVSMGDRDFVKPAVEIRGVLALWKVAIKPGKPLAFGRVGSALFFGLPGNPISAMVTFELFTRPALLRMAGATGCDIQRRVVEAVVMETVPHTVGRREFVRATTEWRNGRFETRSAGGQGSGMLNSAVAADSLLIVREESESISAGEIADVMLLD